MPSTLSRPIRQLKSSWNRLDQLARAARVNELVNCGISRRALARELGCSEALLRHLQKGASLTESAKSDVHSKRVSFRAAVLSATASPTAPQ
jgi:hypothetical protein